MIVQLKQIEGPATKAFDSVLCFGDSDWWYHNRGHADMQFMRRFARQMRVVYVNSLGVRPPSVSEGRMFFRKARRKLGSMARFYRDGGEGFGVLSPMFVPFRGRLARSAARLGLEMQLRLVRKALRFRRPLVWVSCPTAAPFLDAVSPSAVVYQLSDCYGALRDGDSRAGEQTEREIAERADLVLCASQRLLERSLRLYGKGEYVDHGVDYERFVAAARSSQTPREMDGLRRPIVGFFGNLDNNTVDLHLLESVCRLRAQYSFVLVGDMTREFEALKKHSNVVAIPRQPYQRIAAFGAAFNVCIMPWLKNEWIEHCNPVKLKEYLALGKPVVSTPYPELRESGSLCLEASGAEAFAAAIDRAISDDDENQQKKRQAWASKNTWDGKFEFVLRLLRERGIQADV